MDWQDQLIQIFMFIDDIYESHLSFHTQRLNKNVASMQLSFSDSEAMTIYIYGILRKNKDVKSIYHYAKDHLIEWFPNLPSYQKFNERLNRLIGGFIELVAILATHLKLPEWLKGQHRLDAVIDSFPIIMAKRSRADNAKIAKEIADKGYCATKKLWYHGLKLHHLAICIPSTLPSSQAMIITKASEYDGTVFKELIAPHFQNLRVFGDKAYHDEAAAHFLKEEYNIEVVPCQKRRKNQKHLRSDQKLSNILVSKKKQPVESFFNWLESHTNIQIASKVRSTKGVLKHIYARLAAALLKITMF